MNKRISYGNPPLVEVIFQLRFPTILSLVSGNPVDFQEMIKDKYPYYNEMTESISESTSDGQSRIVRSIKNHEFKSKDKLSKINIESSFLAISTRAYSHWEKFKEEIISVVESFEKCYHSQFYTRIGLRYKDVIQPSKWTLDGCAGGELINPRILGFLTDDTNSYYMQAESKNTDGESSTIYKFELGQLKSTGEKVFLIDCDYYIAKEIDITRYLESADLLHDCSSNFIQSAITEKLSKAMVPQNI